jgi:peptide deformylase
MALLPVNLYGDDILNKKAVKVTKVDDKLLAFISDMFDTMENADGIGLAANQVSSSHSLFIVNLSHIEEYAHLGKMIFLNPHLENYSKESVVKEEGCLSIPNIHAEVVRPNAVTLVYQDLKLEKQKLEADDWLARVIQHEHDHLLGIFFTDKVSDEKKKELKKALQDIKDRKIDCDYPVTPKKKKK